MLTSAGCSAYGLAKSRSTSCLPTSTSSARRSCSSVLRSWPSSSAIASSVNPIRSRARASSFRQTWTSSRSPFDSWASRWARWGSCQMLGSASSRCSASRRWPFWGRSKMLLELENLLQQVVGVLEDLFHQSVSVAVLESLAAAAPAGIVAPQLRPGRHRRRTSPAIRVHRGGGRATRPATVRGEHRRGRRGNRRLGPHLHSVHVRGDLELDVVEQLLEGLKGLVLVLDQGVLLAEGPQPDPLFEVFHHRQVADPLGVDGLEHDKLLDLPHHRFRELGLFRLVGRLRVLHHAIDHGFLYLAELIRWDLAER